MPQEIQNSSSTSVPSLHLKKWRERVPLQSGFFGFIEMRLLTEDALLVIKMQLTLSRCFPLAAALHVPFCLVPPHHLAQT